MNKIYKKIIILVISLLCLSLTVVKFFSIFLSRQLRSIIMLVRPDISAFSLWKESWGATLITSKGGKAVRNFDCVRVCERQLTAVTNPQPQKIHTRFLPLCRLPHGQMSGFQTTQREVVWAEASEFICIRSNCKWVFYRVL